MFALTDLSPDESRKNLALYLVSSNAARTGQDQVHHLKTQNPVRHSKARTKAKPEVIVEADLGRHVRTDLGRLLLKARQEFAAAEGRFLDRDELDLELIERRGDTSADLGG